jgi:diaminohydroxyphosphoribosylaminopyrimidine deaminase/5-amino-6-(5-phosphoribosylamino)uracil reductase
VNDEVYIDRAIALAEHGRGRVSPNPMVGAVVVDATGDVVGEGWHRGAGTPHAETLALAEAGERARGATVYTSLEPCDHHARTPPCTEALQRAGVARVVTAMRDPNPIVDGRGLRRLAAAGIEVAEGVRADVAARQNRAFVKHVTTGRPYVVWKVAASLDGKVAARDGSSRWITGDAARADVHVLRSWADALVVGPGTALADDPSLTVRTPEPPERPPLRVLIDGRGAVGATGRLFDDRAPTLVATTDAAPATRRGEWERAGADVAVFDAADGRVPLDELAADLGKRDLQGAVLECGPTLAWAAVAAGVVDAVVAYLAPKLLGGRDAPTVLGGEGVPSVDAALPLRIHAVQRLGDDIRVEADVHRDR